jgi:homoserine O-acetyltransferase
MTMSGDIFTLELEPLTLECGVRLPALSVRGWSCGPADAPVVLLIHALTGDHHADRWWPGVVGPGRPLDPSTHRILCFNNLGSCYGTTGPMDSRFPSLEDVPGERAAPETRGLPPRDEAFLPAPITPWDQARVTLLALDSLGIDAVSLLAGGSLGGMITLCLAALAPERFSTVVPIATDVRATPWVLGWNHVGRQAILADPEGGLGRARQLAHLSYRANPGLDATQGRTQQGAGSWSAVRPYRLQTYLQHQGNKLVQRFDARAYLSQLDAMDHHDLGRQPCRDPQESWRPSRAWGEARLPPLQVVGIDTDQLFPPGPLRALAERVPGSAYHELLSVHGHDAFLLAWDQLGAVLHAVHGGGRG